MIVSIRNFAINIAALFIPNSNRRKEFRQKYKKTDKFKSKIKKLIQNPNLFFFDYFRKKLGITELYITNKDMQQMQEDGEFAALYSTFISKHKEFFGYKRYCNICGYRFSKFGTANRLRPREAQCPVCKSLERDRHLFVFIQSIYPFLEGKKILHFAPEKIYKQIFSKSGADYYDADITMSTATYKIDMTDIKFTDDTFDYIIANHVLEHIPDDLKAMSELHRVLKKGGVAFLSVPLRHEFSEDLTITDPEQRIRLFGQEDHVRYYNLETLCKRLSKAGFNTDMVSGPKSLPFTLEDAKLITEFPFNDTDLNDTFVLARKM